MTANRLYHKAAFERLQTLAATSRRSFLAMKTTTILAAIALLATTLTLSGRAAAQSSGTASDPAVDAYINALRADYNADKIALIAEAMQFSDKDAAAFWPVYKKYQAEVVDLNDTRVQLIKTYADKWSAMSNGDAKNLALKSFNLESARTDLRKKYFAEFSNVLPALTVAKFFQLEHRLDLIVDLKLAAALPSLLDSPASGGTSQKKPN
jgi:hypothetical protein